MIWTRGMGILGNTLSEMCSQSITAESRRVAEGAGRT